MADTFTITIHMVSSLDGLIAKPDNSTSWFETTDLYEKGVQLTKEEIEAFLQSIDCYIMGANTYLHALELSKSFGWAYGDIPVIVLTHRDLPKEKSTIEFYAGDLQEFVSSQLKPRYRNVWLVGGASLAKDFIHQGLADEIRLSVLPVILGEGKSLFEQPYPGQALHLKDITAYKNGQVELWYQIKK